MDLAESVDDLICAFDGTGDRTMDTLAMLVFGWLLAALFVLWLGRLLYGRFVAGEDKRIAAAAAVATNDQSKTTQKGATVSRKGAWEGRIRGWQQEIEVVMSSLGHFWGRVYYKVTTRNSGAERYIRCSLCF